jgi:hypothetical protein
MEQASGALKNMTDLHLNHNIIMESIVMDDVSSPKISCNGIMTRQSPVG